MAGDDDLCGMTELPKGQCDHCRHGDKQVVDRDLVRASMPEALSDFVVAEYNGVCGAGCDDPILPGDHIAVVEEVKGKDGKVVRKVWAHYGCCD